MSAVLRRGKARRSRQARGGRARSVRRALDRAEDGGALSMSPCPGDVLVVRDGYTATTAQVIGERDGVLTLDRAVCS